MCKWFALICTFTLTLVPLFLNIVLSSTGHTPCVLSVHTCNFVQWFFSFHMFLVLLVVAPTVGLRGTQFPSSVCPVQIAELTATNVFCEAIKTLPFEDKIS